MTEAPDTADVRAAKATLRAAALEARRSLDPEVREVLSRSIGERVTRMPAFRTATVIHTYVGALDGEVETRELVARVLRAGKRVICPRTEHNPRRLVHYEIASLDDLERTAFGLWDPTPQRARHVPTTELARLVDVVLVPGIAFDRRGWRIGYGAGYYDRFLADVAATKVGLAYGIQLRPSVPHEAHDVPLDRVVTEGETIDAAAERARA